MRTLCRQIARSMIRVHRISPELARYHASQMDEAELLFRFQKYAGMELSVARRKTQSGPDFYQVFGFATATARRAALNPFPELPTGRRNGQEPARAGRKKPGPKSETGLSPAPR